MCVVLAWFVVGWYCLIWCLCFSLEFWVCLMGVFGWVGLLLGFGWIFFRFNFDEFV